MLSLLLTFLRQIKKTLLLHPPNTSLKLTLEDALTPVGFARAALARKQMLRLEVRYVPVGLALARHLRDLLRDVVLRHDAGLRFELEVEQNC